MLARQWLVPPLGTFRPRMMQMELPWNEIPVMDAVGGEAFKTPLTMPAGAYEWINVVGHRPGFASCLFSLYGGFGFLSKRQFNNCVADTGATWGDQRSAYNFAVDDGDHANAENMYDAVEHHIESFLACDKPAYGASRWQRAGS